MKAPNHRSTVWDKSNPASPKVPEALTAVWVMIFLANSNQEVGAINAMIEAPKGLTVFGILLAANQNKIGNAPGRSGAAILVVYHSDWFALLCETNNGLYKIFSREPHRLNWFLKLCIDSNWRVFRFPQPVCLGRKH